MTPADSPPSKVENSPIFFWFFPSKNYTTSFIILKFCNAKWDPGSTFYVFKNNQNVWAN